MSDTQTTTFSIKAYRETNPETKEFRFIFNGIERFYYVEVAGHNVHGYLFPDGKVKILCYDNDDYNGWYTTREDAQAAIDTYNKKEIPC